MKQIITHGGREFEVQGYTYQVLDRFPEEAQGDSEWWEYQIDFSDARTGAAVMEWNSLHETYNGVVAQRLDEEGAAQALADFTENEIELGEILDNPARLPEK